jgi:SAM-dependent methyltransferase
MYANFAYIYDKLTYDIDYKKWADYIESIFARKGAKPESIVDLGCGTGSFCIEMAARGYDMIGIDLSGEMLSCAQNKALEAGYDILYLQQDMTEFELYGTVDCIVCMLDSLNYITDKRKLHKLFKLVRNYLNPGGFFIFDINTGYKLEKVLGSNEFFDINDDITCLWQNRFDKKKKICRFDLTFFVKENELYRRYDEIHEERAYTIEQINEGLKKENLELLNIYNAFSFKAPLVKSERIFFVCRK